MSAPSELSPVGQLVLARLLVGGETGASSKDLVKALEPLLAHRWSGSALGDRIAETLRGLGASGFTEETLAGKGARRTARVALTPEGRRRALEVAGLEELPPKTNWDKLKKTAIAARALGLPAPVGKAAQAFAKEDGFKAALLKATFDLPLGDHPTITQAIDALTLKLLDLPPAPKFNAKAVQAALIRRALNDDRPSDPKPDPKKEATRLLTRKVGARQSGKDEPRLATIRHWVDGAAGAAQPTPLDLDAFARRVVEAARSSPTGRFGDNKVFIAHVWDALKDDPAFAASGIEAFKSRLAEANNARLLDLSRADLVEAMDPEDVRSSEVRHLGATFHFVRV